MGLSCWFYRVKMGGVGMAIGKDSSTDLKEDYFIAIIGTGFSGVGMAIRLLKAGIDSFVILERSSEIGGTWRDNTYPGAACDVQSHLYSYSFELNPDWTRTFSPQAEIQDYMLHCVEKYRLRRYIHLNTPVQRMDYDDETGIWTVLSTTGETFRVRTVVSACGALSNASLPEIPGIDSFQGEMMHTAQWNHGCDLEQKKVAVIGTGASAIQVVPEIAPVAEHLSVFQRTPVWVIRKPDKPYRERTRRMFKRIPLIQKAYRAYIYLLNELRAPMIIFDTFLSKILENLSTAYLKKSISDPVLRDKLTPNFKLGCKRILISNDWYATLTRRDVELVTSGIEKITADGIVTADGIERPFDVIIAATGFDVPTAAAPFDIYGRGGESLNKIWSQGAEAHRGTTVSGFPNFFIMMGPNTGSGSTSMIYYIESQIEYIFQGIKLLREKNIRSLDVIKACQDRFNAHLAAKMKKMVWSSGCKSWYQASNGKITTLWPGFSWQFRLATRRFDAREYQLVRFDRGLDSHDMSARSTWASPETN